MTSLSLDKFYAGVRDSVKSGSVPTLPTASALKSASDSLPKPSSPAYLSGLGADATLDHILNTIVPALNGQGLSSRYYGFVTGGTLPIAEAADNIVSALDQNVQVHLPAQTIATELENVTLRILAGIVGLENGGDDVFPGRTFTTGATASNVLGLACGREAVISRRLPDGASVGDIGIMAACQAAGVKEIQVLTSMGHSSLSKAASIVGLGRESVKELPYSEDEPWRLNLDAVERELARDGVVSIIAVSAGEVNTGRFAVLGLEEMRRLRELADRTGAWIHIDGAFGIFARALPSTPEFSNLHNLVAGVELADSITMDGHKLLNVPYDCGIFYTRSLYTQTQVFTNPNAAYLSTSAAAIPSPLNIGIENSRRFRALPAYAVLRSEGQSGLAAMLARMVQLARKVAAFVRDSDAYVWLPDAKADLADTHIIVLFRAKDDKVNDELVEKINGTREMYVSGTAWRGQKAVRLAVGSWRVDVEKDFEIVKGVLTAATDGRAYSKPSS